MVADVAAGGWELQWEQQQEMEEPSMSESGFVWGVEDVDPLRTMGAEDWELWWDMQEQSAVAQCLSGEDVGGLVEPDECAPDQRVLGSWVMDSARFGAGGAGSGGH